MIGRKAHKQTYKQTDIHAEIRTGRIATFSLFPKKHLRWTDRKTARLEDRKMARTTNGKIDGQTERLTNKQTDK